MKGYEGARRMELIGGVHNLLTREVASLGKSVRNFSGPEYALDPVLERLAEIQSTLKSVL